MHTNKTSSFRGGFVVMEVILAVGVIAALTGSVAAVWSSRHSFPQARDLQRVVDTDTIAKAIAKNVAAHEGEFECDAGVIAESPKVIASTSYDIAPCLVPEYLPSLPFDAIAPDAYWESVTDYNTGYTIMRNASSKKIIIRAPFAELGDTISASR
ncbi:MAG: hypothetical protein NUV53_00600 [Patescibacteria group bacterium]|nr:hypothetical protein [Patescibacteria group bacterium]